MNCKVNWASVLNSLCTILNSTSIQIIFRQIFCIKFCLKCDWNFGSFLRIHIAFCYYILNIINGNDAQKHYLSIELSFNLLAAFFVKKTRFLVTFRQVQNLGWGYTGEKLKLETGLSLCTPFWGYLHEKLIFWKKLNWIQERSRSLIT